MNDDHFQRDVALLHEAAHVVTRAALGLPHCAVEVDGFGLGQAHGSGEMIPSWMLANVAMAGQAVETRYRAVPDDHLIKRRIASHNAAADAEGDGDYESAVDDAGKAGVYAAEGYRWSIGLLDTHWDHIERVAASLAVRNHLTSGEVLALLKDAHFDHEAINSAAETNVRFLQAWFVAWQTNLAERRASEARLVEAEAAL